MKTSNINVSFLPSTKPAAVESVHQRRPEKLEAKRPEHKAEEGLVSVADAFTLQDQRDATSQSQRNPLQHVQEQKKQHVPQLAPDPRPDSVSPVLRVRPSDKILCFLFYLRFRGAHLYPVHAPHVFRWEHGTRNLPLPPILVVQI